MLIKVSYMCFYINNFIIFGIEILTVTSLLSDLHISRVKKVQTLLGYLKHWDPTYFPIVNNYDR